MVSPTSRRRLPRTRVAVSRPPVLLEICGRQIKSGYVGQAQAKHIVSLGEQEVCGSTDSTDGMKTPAELYRLYSAVIQQALSMLMSPDLSERKVVVIFDSGPDMPSSLREAVMAILLESAGLQAVSFQPSLEMTAFSVQVPSMLVVYFSHTCEAHCMAFSSHQALEYTYQACGVSSPSANTTKGGTRQPQLVKDKVDAMNSMMNVNSPNSITAAVLKCLELCPRGVRKEVISNLFVAGEVYTPNLGVQIARQVRSCLKGDEGDDEEIVLPPNEGDEYKSENLVTRVPISGTTELKSLADSVGVIEVSAVRSDMAPWVGASIWASHWHGTDPEAECFQWTRSKSEVSN